MSGKNRAAVAQGLQRAYWDAKVDNVKYMPKKFCSQR